MRAALIWDLDGTVLDSYKIIVECTVETLRETGIEADPVEVHRYLIANSVKALLQEVSDRLGCGVDGPWGRYQALYTARDNDITLMPGAYDALKAAKDMGCMNFVYTHKGKTSGDVLERLGVRGLFDDILDASMGLPRKPAPDGIEWLVARHDLDKSKTFYIGDRRIDVECAVNSGVRCILFLPPNGVGNAVGSGEIVVRGLSEIPGIIESAV